MLSETLLCPVRKQEVKATPEERVRQEWIQRMIVHLGYPPALMAVEKAIDRLQFLPKSPVRRVDLLVYTEELAPLLLVEFKKSAPKQRAHLQLNGYNFFLHCPFMALASGGYFELIWRNSQGECQSIDFLPTYNELVKSIK